MKTKTTTLLHKQPLFHLGIALVIASGGAAATSAPATISGEDVLFQPLDAAGAGLLGEPIQSSPVAQSAPIEMPKPVDPYAQFAKFIPKGFNIPIPGPAGYMFPDPGGLRSKLADNGFGYWAYSLNTYTYDLHNDGHTDGQAQVYAGQKPSYVSYNYLYGTYDLTRYGIENGQIIGALALVYSTWAPAGPTKASVGVLEYYQTLFNGKLEVTAGNLANSFTYVGVYVGGNLASGTFGVSASIPSETGLGSTFIARPGVNLKLNLGGGFYDMFGAQRSVNPAGAVAEKIANPSEVTLGGKGVGELFIDEVGYHVKASPNQMDTWVRGGYSINDSDYASKKTPGTTGNNFSAYLLGDRQLFSTGGSTQAYRGLYAGFSVMYAPPDINTFSRYYEFRVYDKGPFASRPTDMISFVAARNVFSSYAVESARRAGRLTDSESTAISLSYSANVSRGIFLTAGLSYIDNPRPVVTLPDQSTGLNFAVNATFFF